MLEYINQDGVKQGINPFDSGYGGGLQYFLDRRKIDIKKGYERSVCFRRR